MANVDISREVNRDDEEALPPSSTVSFLHAVGQSTLRQGFAVPVIAQISWLSEIQKGQCVLVKIVFGNQMSVPANLRRINNARGHLQFRYESSKQAPLRDFLREVFGELANSRNGLLRVTELQPRIFLLEPISVGGQKPAHLAICKPYFHNCARQETEIVAEFMELQRCFEGIRYDETHGQADYNKGIAASLRAMAWQEEARILKEIGLRCDFVKNDVWVEIEFGNARAYYQDYVKFGLAMRHRKARLGILLCPTNAFAQLLCDLGQQRAIAKRPTDEGRRPSYSGMMSLEKAMRELPFLGFMLPGRLVVGGIEIRPPSPTIPGGSPS